MIFGAILYDDIKYCTLSASHFVQILHFTQWHDNKNYTKTFNVSKGKICWDIETIITGGFYYKGLYF